MRVIVKARHMNLTEALREHATEKLATPLMRVYDRPHTVVEIELTDLRHAQDRANKECRVTLSMPRGKSVVICEVDDNMYKAIDLTHDRLIEQVKRERGRVQGASFARKHAARDREAVARQSLTAQLEPWEHEVREYERSTARP